MRTTTLPSACAPFFLASRGTCATPPLPLSDDVLASVPIRTELNLVVLPVSVAGSEPFRLVLDTGMPSRGVLLYASPRVDKLGLEFHDAPGVSGGGGTSASVPTRVAQAPRIEVGGLSIPDVPVITLVPPSELPGISEGVIGYELFEKFAVRIDREAGRLDLLDGAKLAPPEGSSVVPLEIRGNASFLSARVAVGDDEPLPAELAIDLGAGHALWLNTGREPRFAAPASAIRSRLGKGLSGSLEGRVGRVRRLQLGDFELDDVVTLFPEKRQQHPGGVDFRDGFVGGATLRRFRVTFDYPRKRMILEPGPGLREPFEHDMTGLVLDRTPEDGRVVASVLEGSPAAEAGVQAGDAILAIDGETPASLGPDRIQSRFRVEGAEVRLVLLRGSTRLEKNLRLRRLV
jgi:hypothetical protein